MTSESYNQCTRKPLRYCSSNINRTIIREYCDRTKKNLLIRNSLLPEAGLKLISIEKFLWFGKWSFLLDNSVAYYVTSDYIDRCFSKSAEESEKNLEGVNTIASEVFVKGDVVRLCILAEVCISISQISVLFTSFSRHLMSKISNTLVFSLSPVTSMNTRNLVT